jgi:hypothetical protein
VEHRAERLLTLAEDGDWPEGKATDNGYRFTEGG